VVLGSDDGRRRDGRPALADPASIRLIFEYDGDRVDLVSRQPVDMVAPSSEPLEDFSDRRGSWVELLDPDGAALHRQVLHHPIRTSSEVFGPGGQESIRRVERASRKGAFTVVVPDLPQAEQVAVVAETPPSPSAARGAPAAASGRRVLRFSLRNPPDGEGRS
jgi:hypothetical protein